MTKQPITPNKSKSFLTSEQVKSILHAHGLSKVFNYSDYAFFKLRAKKAYNKAQAIAQMFIEEYRADSDLNEYVF